MNGVATALSCDEWRLDMEVATGVANGGEVDADRRRERRPHGNELLLVAWWRTEKMVMCDDSSNNAVVRGYVVASILFTMEEEMVIEGRDVESSRRLG